MATKNITFDPDSGVPYGVNLTMYGGANFSANLNVFTTSNAAFDLTQQQYQKVLPLVQHLE